MSAYKRLNKQDAYITTYTAHKQWAVSGSEFDSYGIQIIPSATGNYLNSLQQLYYPTKVSGSIPSHSFDYYYQTTLYNSQSRELTTGSFIISIPRDLTGTYLEPGVGLNITIANVQQIRYVSQSYWGDNYTNDPVEFNTVTALELDDDGEGNLYVSGSNPRNYVGDIIYTHGMIIITDPEYARLLERAWTRRPGLPAALTPPQDQAPTNNNIRLNWRSSQPIFTHNYHCRIRDFEYNYTYNPSAMSSSLGLTYNNQGQLYGKPGMIVKGELNDNITGSAFRPYITTVGLYNDSNQLIAVGKLNRPVPKTADTEMSIIVKIDI